jgi:hypothetical protein
MSRMKSRTWRVGRALARRVNETAEAYGLYPSDLVRWALTVALDDLDAGEVDIPRRPRGAPYRVDFDAIQGQRPGKGQGREGD